MLRIVALFLMLMPALSTAGVFKCVVDGKTTYSQRPCEEGAQQAQVSTAVPTRAPAVPAKQLVFSGSVQNQWSQAAAQIRAIRLLANDCSWNKAGVLGDRREGPLGGDFGLLLLAWKCPIQAKYRTYQMSGDIASRNPIYQFKSRFLQLIR